MSAPADAAPPRGLVLPFPRSRLAETRAQVSRIARQALATDNPAAWRRALEELATSAELADRLDRLEER
jgi:hypothetical protein